MRLRILNTETEKSEQNCVCSDFSVSVLTYFTVCAVSVSRVKYKTGPCRSFVIKYTKIKNRIMRKSLNICLCLISIFET